MDIFLNICALVVVIQVIRGIWNWSTDILSVRQERDDLRKETQYLRKENENLRTGTLLFRGLEVCPLNEDRVELIFNGGSIIFDYDWKLVGLESNPTCEKK